MEWGRVLSLTLIQTTDIHHTDSGSHSHLNVLTFQNHTWAYCEHALMAGQLSSQLTSLTLIS